MKPLYAAGAAKREKIEKLEAQLRRKQLLLPNGIKSNTINSNCENFSKLMADVNENLAKKQTQQPKGNRIQSKKCKENL